MKIAKITNNNVVSACDEEGREIITTGGSVGSKVKEGSTIDEEKVEKILRLEGQSTMDKLKKSLVSLLMGRVQTSAKIISYAKEVLNRSIDLNVYIILTDHINFALERYEQKMMFSNPLIRGVRNFYHARYFISEYAIAMTRRGLGVKLPVDGAASIVLHIVNTEYDAPMDDTIKIANLMQQVLKMVREYLSIELDERSLNYERFAVHLCFLIQRVFIGEHMNLDNLEFQEVIDRPYPEEYACSQKIQAFIKLQYRHQVAKEEVAYLALRTKRIRAK